MRIRLRGTLILLVAVAWITGPAFAIVSSQDRGAWPDDWPADLEPLREQSRTVMVATAIQENIYEIPIGDRETFERIWPAILKVRTPGSPLTLYRTGTPPPQRLGRFLSNTQPAVRIYGPSGGLLLKEEIDPPNPSNLEKLVREGRALHAEAPWPEELTGPHGELPEYVLDEVVNGRLTWLPGDPYGEGDSGLGLVRGTYHRARVDIELVVDGKVIDLNQTPLPDGIVIIDHRFVEQQDAISHTGQP